RNRKTGRFLLALAYPEPKRGMHSDLQNESGTSWRDLSHARVIVEWAPDLVEKSAPEAGEIIFLFVRGCLLIRRIRLHRRSSWLRFGMPQVLARESRSRA